MKETTKLKRNMEERNEIKKRKGKKRKEKIIGMIGKFE